MQTRLGAALITLLVLTGCGRDDGAENAMRVVDELQSALRAGDRSRCRELVTAESRDALSAIPWHELQQKRALHITGAERRDAGYRVSVIDPNEAGRESQFVVVREFGRVVVDLVASAGLTAEFVERPVDRPEFLPRELSPADHDRIRQMSLAAPPR